MKFNVGNVVRCIDDAYSCGDLENGKTYEVTRIYGNCIGFANINNMFYEERFELDLHGLAGIAKEKSIPTQHRKTTLPSDSNDRKNYPLFAGCLRYFPAALAGVAKISKLGNDKHNPGQELHHARGKSMDHGDCIIRHLVDVEDLLVKYNNDDVTSVEDILTEVNQMVWRALAFSQELHERFGAPLAPGAKK